ncbi:tigger transposable element-derived protein 4-like [Dunckerocampus dactyliophorus]|uniref:tigger transposable element-derived protein 4-like n=1 Tax=Dunckerocampus dactyliophorus TaxID=161453 RepID=UPI002405A74E|nr:tigger transposable element-derived protein 4-like [Dunckerocampus dactyliophorus]
MPLDRKRTVRKTANDELNAILYEWFKDSTARQLPVSGPLLQEKAKEIATQLQLDEFKASNGWLDAFRRRHNIIFGKMNGESGGVETAVVDDWKQKLPDLCDGYAFRDIYNMDETGLFYKASIDSTLHYKRDRLLRREAVKGAHHPDALRKRPRGERASDGDHAIKKAWMTSNLFELFSTRRCSGKLSNVKLIFLPPNTTSITQPMDQGIIQAAKLKFRKWQLKSIIHQMEQEPSLTAPELMRNTDILKAIYWVDRATLRQGQVNAEEPRDELDAVCQKELKMSLEELVGVDELLATSDQNQATTLEDYQRRLENADNGDDSDEEESKTSQQEPNLMFFRSIQEP